MKIAVVTVFALTILAVLKIVLANVLVTVMVKTSAVIKNRKNAVNLLNSLPYVIFHKAFN